MVKLIVRARSANDGSYSARRGYVCACTSLFSFQMISLVVPWYARIHSHLVLTIGSEFLSGYWILNHTMTLARPKNARKKVTCCLRCRKPLTVFAAYIPEVGEVCMDCWIEYVNNVEGSKVNLSNVRGPQFDELAHGWASRARSTNKFKTLHGCFLLRITQVYSF